MAQTLIKMKEQKAKEKGVAITDVEDSSRIVRPVRSITTLQPLPTIDPKDKELAQRLHEEELAELERAQQERQRQEDEDVTMAMAQTLIKMKEQKAKEKGVAITDVEDSSKIIKPVRSITTLKPLLTIHPKDKGKGVLVEEELVKIKMRDQGDLQVQADAELA
ncbi:hypothetical protein Tco_0882235 [Tanacetum coccineum]